MNTHPFPRQSRESDRPGVQVSAAEVRVAVCAVVACVAASVGVVVACMT